MPPMEEAIQLKDCNEPASPSGSSLARWTIRASVIASEQAKDKEPIAIMAIAQNGVFTQVPMLIHAAIPKTLEISK